MLKLNQISVNIDTCTAAPYDGMKYDNDDHLHATQYHFLQHQQFHIFFILLPFFKPHTAVFLIKDETRNIYHTIHKKGDYSAHHKRFKD